MCVPTNQEESETYGFNNSEHRGTEEGTAVNLFSHALHGVAWKLLTHVSAL